MGPWVGRENKFFSSRHVEWSAYVTYRESESFAVPCWRAACGSCGVDLGTGARTARQ